MASKYDQGTGEKAIRLVCDHAGDYDSEWAAICEISGRLGMTAGTLRRWIRQDQVDASQVAGVSTKAAREIRELRRNNTELERTIEILKAGTSFFVRECEPLRR